MTTITINERTKAGKLVLELVKILTDAGSKGIVYSDEDMNKSETVKKTVSINKKTPNTITLKAMKDAESGKVYRSENYNDLMKHLNS